MSNELKSPVGALQERLESQIEQLPILPSVIGRLMALNPKSEDYFDQVRRLIEAEPNYSARILSAANSTASAPREPIITLSSAIARIGSTSASNLVLALSVARVFVPKDAWEKCLWRHAIQVACASRALALAAGDSDLHPEELYASALLHDIGRFVMFQEAPEVLRRIDEGDRDDPDSLVSAERTICGLSHSELGALACSKWHLPPTIIEVVRNHHAPSTQQNLGKVQKMTALIHFADFAMFPSTRPVTPGLEQLGEAGIYQALSPRLPPFLRIAPRVLGQVVKESAEESTRLCQLLGVA